MNPYSKSQNHQPKENKVFQLLFSLILSLFIILIAVKFTLMFKPLYYFDIQYLNIEEQSNFNKDEIIKNYDYVIDYLLRPGNEEFRLPSIPYSEYGQIHFKDVKNIFTSIDILLIISGILSFIGIFTNVKKRNFRFIKRTSSMVIMLPIILLTTLIINFDKAFVIFHKIFFRNDYWLFDPDLDPIITILPQEFFSHAALLIVFIILLSFVILKIVDKRLRTQINNITQ